MDIVKKVDKALREAGIKVINGQIPLKDRKKALEITFQVMQGESLENLVKKIKKLDIKWHSVTPDFPLEGHIGALTKDNIGINIKVEPKKLKPYSAYYHYVEQNGRDIKVIERKQNMNEEEVLHFVEMAANSRDPLDSTFVIQTVDSGDNIGWSVCRAKHKQEALEKITKKKIKGEHEIFSVKEYTKRFGKDAYNAIEPMITSVKNFQFMGWD
jgi:hypothetical protein